MITWGIAASAGALVVGPNSLYLSRLILGAAEAGFFSGVIMYLATWFPRQLSHARVRVVPPRHTRIIARGRPRRGVLLGMDGYLHLAGWQWIFLAVALLPWFSASSLFFLLVDHPRDAKWLTADERNALLEALNSERKTRATQPGSRVEGPARPHVDGDPIRLHARNVRDRYLLPLILKEHHLTYMQIGLLSVPPYLAASLGMLLWHAWPTITPPDPEPDIDLCARRGGPGRLRAVFRTGTAAPGPDLALIGVLFSQGHLLDHSSPVPGWHRRRRRPRVITSWAPSRFFRPFTMGWLKDLTAHSTAACC